MQTCATRRKERSSVDLPRKISAVYAVISEVISKNLTQTKNLQSHNFYATYHIYRPKRISRFIRI